uniref:Uncharacterized protein n=1 Tax=Bubo bubo TaxID=30461 RepID=A0A8C0F448_BUBBB
MEPHAPTSRDQPDGPSCSPPSSLPGRGGAPTCQLLSPLLSPGRQDQVDLFGSATTVVKSYRRLFTVLPQAGRDRFLFKKPVGKSTISYDYSEEELMASIEREYCR